MAKPESRRNVLFYLAAEGVIPVLGGCAGALIGGPSAGIAGVAVGHAVDKAINLFGRGIVERWRAWFARNPTEAASALAELAALPVTQARAEAKGILLDLAPDVATPDLSLAVEFLSAIPRAIDRALVPDPTGKTRSLPPTVSFDDPRSLLQLLPEDVPPYPTSAALPGTPYQLVELLGAGGFGAVYRAISPTLQHLPLAIKFCLDQTLLPALNQERSNLERLMRAGERGSGNVVRLYGYDFDHPTPYLVYEYVAGGDLTKLVGIRQAALGRAVDPGEVLGWVTQIANGLAFAHRTGVVHRDLKPANVLVDTDHELGALEGGAVDRARSSASVRLKLADFGLGGVAVARAVARSRIGTTTLDYLSLADQASLFRGAGTPLYMSPEQRRGASPDPRHDLYALGVVWYQLLTGDVSRELHHGWAKELAVRYGVPREHTALIERCIGWFDERPRDAGELLPLLKEAARLSASPIAASVHNPGPISPAISTAAADTVVGASQVTPAPAPSDAAAPGRRRGVAATVARLNNAYAELDEMKGWRFEVTVLYGFAIGLLVGWLVGEVVYAGRNNYFAFPMAFRSGAEMDWFANLVGTFVGLVVWVGYVWLIRSGVKAVAEDVQKRADGLVEELVSEYQPEVAAWGGRSALRHPATVRQIRQELLPAHRAALPPTSSLTPDDLTADPTHRAVLVARLRDLNRTLAFSADSVNGSWMGLVFLWLVGLPVVVGGVIVFLTESPRRMGDLEIIAVVTLVGVVATWVSWWGTAVIRRYARGRAIEAGDLFAADYPRLVAAWGGRGTLGSRETIGALIKTLDPSAGASKGMFRRLFGG